MKIHIFALRWRDEIKRSSQLRTLLKRVVVKIGPEKNSGSYVQTIKFFSFDLSN